MVFNAIELWKWRIKDWDRTQKTLKHKIEAAIGSWAREARGRAKLLLQQSP